MRRSAPVPLMGLANTTFGLVGGFLVLPLPQLLAAQGIPAARIGAISAACFSPGFWTFLLGPMLDLRFSRRWYAAVFAVLAGAGLAVAVLMRERLPVLEAALIVSYAAACLSSNALGGLLATVVQRDDEARLSAWTQVGTFLGNGLMAGLAAEGVNRLPLRLAAVLLGGMVMLPALILLWIPVPERETEQAQELFRELRRSFAAFFVEIWTLLRRRDVLLTLLLFVAPTGAFALTNLLGGVAGDFHASEAYVSRMGGVVLSVAGTLAALLVPVLARRVRALPLYLGIGVAGSVFTLLLILLPRTPGVFATAFLGENVFQAMSFTAAVAITFAVIGRENPLAATQFGLLTSATVLPILYMGMLDGKTYSGLGPVHGLAGTYAVDGGVSLVACVVLYLLAQRLQ